MLKFERYARIDIVFFGEMKFLFSDVYNLMILNKLKKDIVFLVISLWSCHHPNWPRRSLSMMRKL